MSGHRCEIIPIAGRQRRLGADGNGSDATVRVALGSPAREIEKFRGLLGIGASECFGIGEKTSRQRLCRGRQRPAEELAPDERADSQRLARAQPAHELRFPRTAGHERIDQEVRVEMNHVARSGEPLSPCIRHRILPRRRTFRRQPHLILQLSEHLEGFGRCHRRRVRIHPAADFHPLRRRQLCDGGFNFSERAHEARMHITERCVNFPGLAPRSQSDEPVPARSLLVPLSVITWKEAAPLLVVRMENGNRIVGTTLR